MLKDWMKIAKMTTFLKWLYFDTSNALSIIFSPSGTFGVAGRWIILIWANLFKQKIENHKTKNDGKAHFLSVIFKFFA